MIDFTLSSYKEYLGVIKYQYKNFFRINEFLSLTLKPDNFCLIRHDVDRKPLNALKMSELEYKMGFKTTYYFRVKPHTFKEGIIKTIASYGHEIGYHYESLSDTKGDIYLALQDFEENLEKLRKFVPVNTISMHGRPSRSFDNRNIWSSGENRKLLREKFKILGEVYLDIDYSDVLYITDTGRNWHPSKSKLRDKTNSQISANFKSGKELLNYLKGKPHPKFAFQVHPERWDDNLTEWCLQLVKDRAINLLKQFII